MHLPICLWSLDYLLSHCLWHPFTLDIWLVKFLTTLTKAHLKKKKYMKKKHTEEKNILKKKHIEKNKILKKNILKKRHTKKKHTKKNILKKKHIKKKTYWKTKHIEKKNILRKNILKKKHTEKKHTEKEHTGKDILKTKHTGKKHTLIKHTQKKTYQKTNISTFLKKHIHFPEKNIWRVVLLANFCWPMADQQLTNFLVLFGTFFFGNVYIIDHALPTVTQQ